MTCGVFSITLLATEMGCLILSRKATLPQLKCSSIIDASRVTKPSRSGLAPSPTQQFWEDSVTITPASTASRALPPLPSIFQAPLFASIPASQVETTRGWFCQTVLGLRDFHLRGKEIPAKPSREDCKKDFLSNMVLG